MGNAYRNRGATHLAKKQLAEAIADLTEAIHLDPKDRRHTLTEALRTWQGRLRRRDCRRKRSN